MYRSKEKLPLSKEMYKPKLRAEVAAAFVKRTTEMMKRKVNFTSRVTSVLLTVQEKVCESQKSNF